MIDNRAARAPISPLYDDRGDAFFGFHAAVFDIDAADASMRVDRTVRADVLIALG